MGGLFGANAQLIDSKEDAEEDALLKQFSATCPASRGADTVRLKVVSGTTPVSAPAIWVNPRVERPPGPA